MSFTYAMLVKYSTVAPRIDVDTAMQAVLSIAIDRVDAGKGAWILQLVQSGVEGGEGVIPEQLHYSDQRLIMTWTSDDGPYQYWQYVTNLAVEGTTPYLSLYLFSEGRVSLAVRLEHQTV